jgi:DNA-binding response OmpR family regulator
MCAQATVVIVDDDPAHLRIYGWIVEASGYRALPVEVQSAGIELPDGPVDVVLLDYNLGRQTTAVEVATLVRTRLPSATIMVLSDLWDLPADIAPLVQGFVRKGEPAKLVEALHSLLQASP